MFKQLLNAWDLMFTELINYKNQEGPVQYGFKISDHQTLELFMNTAWVNVKLLKISNKNICNKDVELKMYKTVLNWAKTGGLPSSSSSGSSPALLQCLGVGVRLSKYESWLTLRLWPWEGGAGVGGEGVSRHDEDRALFAPDARDSADFTGRKRRRPLLRSDSVSAFSCRE